MLAQIVVVSAGFASTPLPTDKAAAICPVKMASGKFQGEMQVKIPLAEEFENFSASLE